MNCATIAYVPPPAIGHPRTFLQNIRDFESYRPVILYSDSRHYAKADVDYSCASPDICRTAARPWAVNNCCFFFGLKLAVDLKLDYFLYLEEDCRVGLDNWDRPIWKMVESASNSIMVAGSPVVYNPSNGGHAALDKIAEFTHRHFKATGRGVPMYGSIPGQANVTPALYPNGAAGVYHTETMRKLFPGFEADIGRYAQRQTAWDLAIGYALWARMGTKVFDHFGCLPNVLSCYGDDIYTLSDRVSMLENGRVDVIHQVKTDWTPKVT